MRKIEPTSTFKRDFKREAKGRHAKVLQLELLALLQLLATDKPLEVRLRDHALTGEWKDHRDCHVRPDLVLIYRKPDDDTLQLVRLGSHSELGLQGLTMRSAPAAMAAAPRGRDGGSRGSTLRSHP